MAVIKIFDESLELEFDVVSAICYQESTGKDLSVLMTDFSNLSANPLSVLSLVRDVLYAMYLGDARIRREAAKHSAEYLVKGFFKHPENMTALASAITVGIEGLAKFTGNEGAGVKKKSSPLSQSVSLWRRSGGAMLIHLERLFL